MSRLIDALRGVAIPILAASMAFLAGCTVSSAHRSAADQTIEDMNSYADCGCDPIGNITAEGKNAKLELPDEKGSHGAKITYQWYRYMEGIPTRILDGGPFKDTDKATMKIEKISTNEVAYYGRVTLVNGVPVHPPTAIPCGHVYNVMVSGTSPEEPDPTTVSMTVWGAPVVKSATSTTSYCGGVTPCPGPYARYVTYSTGWRPTSTNSVWAGDGSTATAQYSKIRYGCAPPVTPPTCGCSGRVDILSATMGKRYTFTIYFPAGVTPLSPHPLVLNNMQVIPP